MLLASCFRSLNAPRPGTRAPRPRGGSAPRRPVGGALFVERLETRALPSLVAPENSDIPVHGDSQHRRADRVPDVAVWTGRDRVIGTQIACYLGELAVRRDPIERRRLASATSIGSLRTATSPNSRSPIHLGLASGGLPPARTVMS